MPKKSKDWYKESQVEGDNAGSSYPVYSSKKQYKEDIEGKFDLIIEADEINESDTEKAVAKQENLDSKLDEKMSNDSIEIETLPDQKKSS